MSNQLEHIGDCCCSVRSMLNHVGVCLGIPLFNQGEACYDCNCLVCDLKVGTYAQLEMVMIVFCCS